MLYEDEIYADELAWHARQLLDEPTEVAEFFPDFDAEPPF